VLSGIRAAKALNVSLRTLERWEGWDPAHLKPRGGNPRPHNALLPEERRLIRELVEAPELVALAPRELSFYALEGHGRYVSHVAIWRHMRERGVYEGLDRKRRPRARGALPPDTSFASAPNQLWCWDISYLLTFTPGCSFYLYTILDWVSRKVVAWHLSESLASSEVPVVWDKAIAGENLLEVPRCLWPLSMSDRGTQMRSRFTRRYFALLDVEQLFGRPRTPNDQARIEALFSTLKTHPFYPGRFTAFEEALAWCERFFHSYNHERHHRALGFVTPAQRHSGEHVRILEERRRQKAQALERRRLYNVSRKHGASGPGEAGTGSAGGLPPAAAM
jgi:putative transposase